MSLDQHFRDHLPLLTVLQFVDCGNLKRGTLYRPVKEILSESQAGQTLQSLVYTHVNDGFPSVRETLGWTMSVRCHYRCYPGLPLWGCCMAHCERRGHGWSEFKVKGGHWHSWAGLGMAEPPQVVSTELIKNSLKKKTHLEKQQHNHILTPVFVKAPGNII